MSWLKEIVRPKIMTRQRRGVSADVWEKCPGCGEMVYAPVLAENLGVCPECGHHLRISLEERLAYLLGEGGGKEIQVPQPAKDPLKFKDSKRYTDRLKAAVRKTGNPEAFRLVQGRVGDVETVVCAMDFSFMGGSMGAHLGQALVVAARTALRKKCPLLVVSASGGARMQEGILSLMQMARTTAAIAELKDAGLPYLVLLTDPTTGGVTASFAMLGDVLMAEPGTLIGFAGPRVIRQTIGQTLPEGFQRAEYLLENGMIDRVMPRSRQVAEISQLLSLLLGNRENISVNGK